MIKTIYAQKAGKGHDRQAFVQEWRSHGAIAMQLPSFWGPVERYIQADRLTGDDFTGPGGGDYIAIGEIHYRDTKGLEASKASPELKTVLAPDADRFFDRSSSISMPVSQVAGNGGDEGSYRLYVFVKKTAGSSREDLAEALRDAKPAALASSAWVSINPDSPYDGVFEMVANSVEAVAALQGSWSKSLGPVVDAAASVVVPAHIGMFCDMRRGYYSRA